MFKNISARMAIVGLLFFGVFLIPAQAQASDPVDCQTQVAQLETRLEVLSQNYTELYNRNQALNDSYATLRSYYLAVNNTNHELLVRVNHKDEKIAELRQLIRQLRDE